MPKKAKRGGGGGAAKRVERDSAGSDDDGSMFNDAGSVSSMGVSEVSTAAGGIIYFFVY